VEVDDRDDRMKAKIRDAQLAKVPYMLVVGDREAESGAVAVRLRTERDLGSMSVADFAALAHTAIDAHTDVESAGASAAGSTDGGELEIGAASRLQSDVTSTS
jgi:threonyl-tRNA synthetase